MKKANNTFATRKVNEIDLYQQVQDQDFRTLSNFNKGDDGLNQSDSYMLDRLRETRRGLLQTSGAYFPYHCHSNWTRERVFLLVMIMLIKRW